MPSSRTRRQARRFCLSALKGASRVRWRDFRTVWVRCVPAKASYGAERSFRSKRKSHRGLRSFSSKRARGGKPRQPDDRQPVSEPKDRLIERSLREIDFWEGRLSHCVTKPLREKYQGIEKGVAAWVLRSGIPLPGPHDARGDYLFLAKDESAKTGLRFDDVAYRRFRARFEGLHRRACKCAASRMSFPASWGQYLEKTFGYVISKDRSARLVLSSMQGDVLRRALDAPRRVLHIGRYKKTWRKPGRTAAPVRKTAAPCVHCGSPVLFRHERDCPMSRRVRGGS